jgi:hypothetical protein
MATWNDVADDLSISHRQLTNARNQLRDNLEGKVGRIELNGLSLDGSKSLRELEELVFEYRTTSPEDLLEQIEKVSLVHASPELTYEQMRVDLALLLFLEGRFTSARAILPKELSSLETSKASEQLHALREASSDKERDELTNTIKANISRAVSLKRRELCEAALQNVERRLAVVQFKSILFYDRLQLTYTSLQLLAERRAQVRHQQTFLETGLSQDSADSVFENANLQLDNTETLLIGAAKDLELMLPVAADD